MCQQKKVNINIVNEVILYFQRLYIPRRNGPFRDINDLDY